MTVRTIGCAEALRLLAAYLDKELDDVNHSDMERHLDACRSCYAHMEFEKQLKSQLAELGHRQPDERLAERIRRVVRQFTQPIEPDQPARRAGPARE